MVFVFFIFFLGSLSSPENFDCFEMDWCDFDLVWKVVFYDGVLGEIYFWCFCVFPCLFSINPLLLTFISFLIKMCTFHTLIYHDIIINIGIQHLEIPTKLRIPEIWIKLFFFVATEVFKSFWCWCFSVYLWRRAHQGMFNVGNWTFKISIQKVKLHPLTYGKLINLSTSLILINVGG